MTKASARFTSIFGAHNVPSPLDTEGVSRQSSGAQYASVTGGDFNIASSVDASVSGGASNRAEGIHSSILGGARFILTLLDSRSPE